MALPYSVPRLGGLATAALRPVFFRIVRLAAQVVPIIKSHNCSKDNGTKRYPVPVECYAQEFTDVVHLPILSLCAGLRRHLVYTEGRVPQPKNGLQSVICQVQVDLEIG